MQTKQLIDACRGLIDEIHRVEDSLPAGIEGGPQNRLTAWPTGMPYGTNAPVMALFQRIDVNEALDRLGELHEKLDRMLKEIADMRRENDRHGNAGRLPQM